MPEIIEIEILRKEVSNLLKGKKIKEVVINKESLLNTSEDEFSSLVKGKEIVGARRKGKVLIIDLEGGISVAVHFLLTGFMKLTEECDTEKVQVGFLFEDGTCLAINGIMRGGFVKVLKSEDVFSDPSLKKLGIDAMSPELTAEKLLEIFERNKKKKVKQVLMDQSIISGIGNAYSDEILFEAGISPLRKCGDIAREEAEKILASMKKVFEEAESFGGASELTFVHLDGKKGEYHKHFKVHKRAGEPCVKCKGSVESVKINGRMSFYCPNCQK